VPWNRLTWIIILDLYSFLLIKSLRMAPRCQNTQEFNTCHDCILLNACVGCCINCKNMHGRSTYLHSYLYIYSHIYLFTSLFAYLFSLFISLFLFLIYLLFFNYLLFYLFTCICHYLFICLLVCWVVVFDMIYDVYLLQLGFHLVVVVGKLV
jgi:hypothetical protein